MNKQCCDAFSIDICRSCNCDYTSSMWYIQICDSGEPFCFSTHIFVCSAVSATHA